MGHTSLCDRPALEIEAKLTKNLMIVYAKILTNIAINLLLWHFVGKVFV
jgi:hypothetical protein